MKQPIKSIGLFVCGAAVASLPYTLSLGSAMAQGTTSTSSHSDSKGAHSSAQASSSQYSSSSRNSSASDMMNQLARAGQSQNSGGSSGGSSSNSSGEMPIMALTNDDQYVYAAVGSLIYKVKKTEMGPVTTIPMRRVENVRP